MAIIETLCSQAASEYTSSRADRPLRLLSQISSSTSLLPWMAWLHFAEWAHTTLGSYNTTQQARMETWANERLRSLRELVGVRQTVSADSIERR